MDKTHMEEATTAVIDSEIFDGHIPDTDLPETPMRTLTIRRALCVADLDIVWLEPIPMTKKELYIVHKKLQVQTVYARAAKATFRGNMQWVNNDPEVLVSEGSIEAIEYGTGSAKQAVELVFDDSSSICRVFCNIRPPGHHAHKGKGQGFCIFNNIIIAATYARRITENPHLRITIIDWDVHHANGTQHFLLNADEQTQKNTLFFSIHQNYKTIWPGTGKESTHGPYNMLNCHNIPVGGDDSDMQNYFTCILIPKLHEFRPELILISCGFDGHILDDISQLEYSSALYGWMTDQLVAVADEHSGGRIVSILEGGYNMQALAESSVYHVSALC